MCVHVCRYAIYWEPTIYKMCCLYELVNISAQHCLVLKPMVLLTEVRNLTL